LGFVLAAPVAGGFYAFTHGLAKSSLFLIAGNLPSRNFQELKARGIELKMWLALIIASLSISGFPLVAGFGAKVWTTKNLLPWQAIAINIATVGTAITFAKFIFLPRFQLDRARFETIEVEGETRIQGDSAKKIQSGFWWAMIILLGGLIVANGVYYEAYTLENLVKSLVKIAIGWLVYLSILRKSVIKLPSEIEQFEHLIGGMSLVLILVFWMVQIQLN
jgi:multicomponent Na+:H+ antiporter subunit D